MNAEDVGLAAMLLGGGRQRAEDDIDHAVGILCRAKPGQAVRAGDSVYEVHYCDSARWHEARQRLEASFTIADIPPAEAPLVIEEFL
jgi:thymidine phosphorylase